MVEYAFCCGCSACCSACPQKCISMKSDAEGFYYPSVDVTNCINCNLCKKVCPAVASHNRVSPLTVLAAHSCKDDLVRSSSSGGIFTVLAQSVLSNKGIVYGARYDDALNVVFDSITAVEDLPKLRGSKYVQARINGCYQDAKQKLQQGVLVLFTGTPCQIAGLKTYLRKPYNNLITMEVVCHGVPSEKVWQKHLLVIKEKHLNINDISHVAFRYKESNWRAYKLSYSSENGVAYTTPRGEDAYFCGFVQSLYSRPSCENCKFKNGASGADITVGDLWGAERILEDGGNPLGESLVIVNTSKGKQLIEENAIGLVSTRIELADALPYNEGLNEKARPHRNRGKFFEELNQTNDVDALITEMLRPTMSELLKEKNENVYGWLSKIKHLIVKSRN